MEDVLDIPVVEEQQQDPPLKKLYKGLVGDKKYTKSYDDFVKQYSTPESIDKLYSGLVEDGDYTKTKEEFQKQYFQSIKPSKKKSWFSGYWRKLLISRIGFRNPFYIRDTNSS